MHAWEVAARPAFFHWNDDGRCCKENVVAPYTQNLIATRRVLKYARGRRCRVFGGRHGSTHTRSVTWLSVETPVDCKCRTRCACVRLKRLPLRSLSATEGLTVVTARTPKLLFQLERYRLPSKGNGRKSQHGMAGSSFEKFRKQTGNN